MGSVVQYFRPVAVAMADLTSREIYSLAKERASLYAPAPTRDPITTGIVGLGLVTLGLIVFTSFAGLDPNHFPVAIVITLGLGFAVPFGALKYQQNLHSKAFAREYRTIVSEQKNCPKKNPRGGCRRADDCDDAL